ncbi:MAG: type II secretion system protein [Candidatus Kerfeldbacteria bacterium]|nr:type II secretion system protein [Candidatus Kerfeldbacteria bacterium]
MRKKTSPKGFTLIELLIVIGIIAVLAALTFVAVNPMKRFKQARDTERRTSVDAILNAILKYQVDNNGNLPNNGNLATGSLVDWENSTSSWILGTTIATTTCSATSTCLALASTTVATTCLDLTGALVNEYLDEMPIDPYVNGGWSATLTGYYVKIDETPSTGGGSSGRLTVGSCDPELDANQPMKSTR